MLIRAGIIASGLAAMTVLGSGLSSDSAQLTRWLPAEGGGQLRFRGEPLLDVRSESPAPAPPWTIDSGKLSFAGRTNADTFAIHQRPLSSSADVFECVLRIEEGDVAGVVLRADKAGMPCYGVLLSAQSNCVRIVYLPWPGRDLHIAPAAIERNRLHKLRVLLHHTPKRTRFEVKLDELDVTTFVDSRYKPAGSHIGVMTNNSISHFERIAAYPAAKLGTPVFEDTFDRDSTSEYRQKALPLPSRWEDGALTFKTTFPGSGQGMGAIAELTHHVKDARHVWIPHVSPYADTVIGDHSFRSPVILLANDRLVTALIPDLDDVRNAQADGWRVWLDYDHESRLVRVAAGDYGVGRFHVAYQPRSINYRGQEIKIRLRVRISERKQDIANPYAVAARFHWSRWGKAGYEAGGSQRAPLAEYSRHVINWAFEKEPRGWGDTVWQEFTIFGKECGAPAFIVDVAQHPSVPLDKRRWREQRSVWNQAWFSNQRTANGLLRYSRQIGSTELERRARLMKQVALSAPQTDGLFPAVYTAGGGGYRLYSETPGWDKGRWTNSDRRPPGVSEQAVHILDAAFTCRLLLEWHDLNPSESESVSYVRRFADRLCRLQQPDGSFPGWVEPNGTVPSALAAGPESAMSATLLLDLARRNMGETKYRESAEKALKYLEAGPVNDSRWEDFETYYSCSRWGSENLGRKISRNGVYKSNTFSPFWCAEAFLEGSRVLKDARWLALGRRCLDELSLYQQVWEPPTIPAPTHGGFGVMNADGEWNDARQSLFAPLYLEYFRDTGHEEYFERGISALRAAFAMMYCPENNQVKAAYEKQHPFFGPESYGFMMENIAHGGPGPDPIGPFTIFTWGNGAALEAAAKVRDKFGDVYFDKGRKRAFGVDGFAVTIKGNSLQIRDRYARKTVTIVTSQGKRHKRPLRDKAAVIPIRDL